jgi:hypothetical protein
MVDNSTDIEAAPATPTIDPAAPTRCSPSRKRAASFLSAALFTAAIATAVILSSGTKNHNNVASVHAQDANAIDSYPIFTSPSSNNDRQIIPDGYGICNTESSCNARRQELGFTRYTVSDSLTTKGCFSKGPNIAYFGSGGSPSSTAKVDLPGRQERIFCKLDEVEEASFATLSIGERIVTYLAPFKRIKLNGPNVELADGTFYELINLSEEYDDSDWITGVTHLALPPNVDYNADGTIDMKGTSPRFVENIDTRSENRFEGRKSVLVVRVVAAENKTTVMDESSLADSIFGIDNDTVNLVSQFDDCSYGKLKFVTATPRSGKSVNSGSTDIINGVATVHVPVKVEKGTAEMRNAVSKELNAIFSTTNPQELADYVIYCLPPGTFATGTYSTVGYAYYNNWLSVINNNWCSSLSLQMHEIGHSLNFGHSNENGETYEDGSGNMGASYKSSDRPRMCFNAAKSWQTGWYRDKEVTVGDSLFGVNCFDGTLHGIADYDTATTVLIKVNGKQTDVFVDFNARRGMNKGTQEGADQVLVVSRVRGKRDSFAMSDLRAKLSEGDSFDFEGYTISVASIDVGAGTAEVKVVPAGVNVCQS